jgi:nucleotide-binding universal stress UspA family protein
VDEVVAERRAAASPLPERHVEVIGAVGPPADVLVDASDGADLLVVGHRGRGDVHGRLTGPVALGCVLRGRCPVTVVPATPRRVARQVPQPADRAG